MLKANVELQHHSHWYPPRAVSVELNVYPLNNTRASAGDRGEVGSTSFGVLHSNI